MNMKHWRLQADERDRLQREREIAECAGCGAQLRLDLDGAWKGRCTCPLEGLDAERS